MNKELEEAINIMKKQIDMYFNMLISLSNSNLECEVKENLVKEIKLRQYIVNILEKQKKYELGNRTAQIIDKEINVSNHF